MGAHGGCLDGVEVAQQVGAELLADAAVLVGVHGVTPITNSQINASGFRKGSAGVSPSDPGDGISVEGFSEASIYSSSITGSAAAGVDLEDSARLTEVEMVQLFDNSPTPAAAADR